MSDKAEFTHELSEITEKLDVITARLCGIEPALQMLCDQSGDAKIGDQLEMIGGLSAYINDELCDIVGRLRKMQPESRVEA